GAGLCGLMVHFFQQIGEHLGLAFQVVDDLLDRDGIVSILGEKKAEQMAENLFEKASTLIQQLPGGAPKLDKIAKDMVFRVG
ncbi:MAG: hypothetical protein K1000chlam2_00727, partial [Chlamydiae bacterium]|nr:hypothetical protein [Chlamydiota bacterium]